MIYKTEQEAIALFILQYKELPDKNREWARHKAKCIVDLQGSKPDDRRFNKMLLAKMQEAEQELILLKGAKHSTVEPIQQPTFVEVAMLFRPIFYGLSILILIGWFALTAWNFIKGTAAQVQVLGREWGGYLALSAFGVLLLSMLPKPKFGGDENGKTTTEKFEQETFWQKTTYEKTTEK